MRADYRRLCTKLGGAMLFHFGFLNIVMSSAIVMLELAAPLMAERTYNLVYQLVYAALYLCAFMLPVAFFRFLDRGNVGPTMGMEPSLGWRTIPLVLAVLGVNIPCAYLNGWLMDLLESIGIDDILNYAATEIVYSEDYVLLHMTLALVPAFCEEFLFRGLICARLMPYGRATAVVGSAILFGLMHGNLGQFFYTTMAGIMLGYCYVETRSIWPGVIAHMLNNLTGFLAEGWYNNLPERTAMVYDAMLCLGLIFAGLISLVWLWRTRRQNSAMLGLGSTIAPGDAADALPSGEAVRGFFRPTMVIYFVLSVGGMLLYLGMGVLLTLLESMGAALPLG